MTQTTQTEPLRQEIEQYAYFLYEQRGCQPGHELDDWLEAEKQLMGDFSNAAQTTSPPTDDEEQQSSARQTKRPTDNNQPVDVY